MDAKLLAELLHKYPNAPKSEDGLTVITCPVRLAFVSFDKPRAPKGTNKEPRYSCCVIVPAEADVTALKAAQRKAWETSEVSKSRNAPKMTAIKSQDAMAGEGYEGFSTGGIYFNAETKTPVDLFGADMSKAPVDKFYSGVWARVKIRFAAYDVAGNYGVKAWLQGVQFIADDAKFSGGGSAEDGFEPVAAPAGNGPAAMPNGAANGAGALW